MADRNHEAKGAVIQSSEQLRPKAFGLLLTKDGLQWTQKYLPEVESTRAGRSWGPCEPQFLVYQIRAYQISLTPSCIWRLPPVNWRSFRNKSEVTLA